MYDANPRFEYRSWVGEDAEWKDDVGHGTHLAVLLRKISPNAAIHVARVFKKRPHIEKSAQNIAEVGTSIWPRNYCYIASHLILQSRLYGTL